jgi:hypothetical protein
MKSLRPYNFDTLSRMKPECNFPALGKETEINMDLVVQLTFEN